MYLKYKIHFKTEWLTKYKLHVIYFKYVFQILVCAVSVGNILDELTILILNKHWQVYTLNIISKNINSKCETLKRTSKSKLPQVLKYHSRSSNTGYCGFKYNKQIKFTLHIHTDTRSTHRVSHQLQVWETYRSMATDGGMPLYCNNGII